VIEIEQRIIVVGTTGSGKSTLIAHTVVWLDYPLWLIYWRLFRRSLKRIISREILWNNNRESFYSQFFAKDSLFVRAKQMYKRR
jgi:adenylate kinase family enzyme